MVTESFLVLTRRCCLVGHSGLADLFWIDHDKSSLLTADVSTKLGYSALMFVKDVSAVGIAVARKEVGFCHSP